MQVRTNSFQGDHMIEVTEEAIKKITQFLNEQEKRHPIRIRMTEGGWKGPYLVMELDEEKENDRVFTEYGVTFLIEDNLLERVKRIKIDYVHSSLGSGYSLESDLLKAVRGENAPPVCQSCCPSGE
jgi:iron-sulfur cluster assembly accessory protein